MGKKINVPSTILIVIGSIFVLFPLYMVIIIAIKSPQQMADSILAIPSQFHFENFSNAIKQTNFFHAFRNSAIISFFAVVLTILTNSMVAYAIARGMKRSKFFKALYYYFIAAMFIPFPIIMLPIVKQTSFFHMDNPVGLVVLYVVYGMAFKTMLYVGYIKSIPYELEEAASIDGASQWTTYWKVIFPMLKPMNATVGILTCLWAWNDFMLPLLILNDQKNNTLPLVQYVFQSEFGTDFNLAFSSYLMAMLPMIIVYVFAQKYIIGGVTRGSIK